MANKPLRTIKFPGLDDTYTVPQVDSIMSGTSTNPVQNKVVKEYTDALRSGLANEYNSATTYAVGDFCIYNNLLYECTTEITTAEAWNSSHWTLTNVSDEISDLKEDLNSLGLSVVNGKLCVTYLVEQQKKEKSL